MARRAVVGLDIGTSGVRAVELHLGSAGPRLDKVGEVALPVGAVRDGEVVDVAAVAGALRQLWKTAGFGTKKVVVGVGNQKVVVRQIDLPWLPAGELRASLAFQVQDFIPMPVEQAILDVHPLTEFTAEGGARSVRVLLVAAARPMVEAALQAVEQAGLVATMVDLTSFAVLRSMAHTGTGLDVVEAEALVDVGAAVTNIVIHRAGVPHFVRILLMGGGDVTAAVSERLGLPVEEAEAIKRRTGFPTLEQTLSDPAAAVIEQTASQFVEEVRGSLDYYLAQNGSTRIGRIVLSGGGSQLSGLVERLGAATRLPVETARPVSLLHIGKTGLTPEQLAHSEPTVAVPVGLALGRAS